MKLYEAVHSVKINRDLYETEGLQSIILFSGNSDCEIEKMRSHYLA